MSDPQALRANEKIKLIAGGLFQLASALFAAAAVRIYVDDGLSFDTGLWLVVAVGLMFVAVQSLSLLRSEGVT